ncbi:LamG domain-containing protein [Ferrimonas senticii]|uniref:LamG domain-containing protein n=1 Tax=Ferrimonas senticii TaxID=394566 RepID=UPI00041C82D8|nr:LamG domain-containing protein [Ferrimonas senticii]
MTIQLLQWVHLPVRQLGWLVLGTALISGLSGCGGGDNSVQVQNNPPPPDNSSSGEYLGPPPATQDIQKYKTHLWDNIAIDNRCGACHTPGGQAPFFANRDDVNLAYAATTALVNLSDPASSRLVEKVAAGHNCWLTSNSACGETISQWIRLWSDERVSTVNVIELTAPVLRDPGASKNFPADPALFANHVYPLLTQYCAACHSETAAVAQSPFFASNEVAKAYEAAKTVINLDQPEQSRLVVRLGSEFHNCWSNCQQDSAQMLAAIDAMAAAIPLDEIAPELLVSKSLRLVDGITASAGGRYEDDLIALYQFKAGEGRTAFDTSGIAPAANLTLSGEVSWLGSWGLSFVDGKAQASTASSKKLHDLIRATNEFALEAWLTPNNVTQEGPARIISYSAGDQDRNVTLGQTLYNYDFLLRSSESDNNGQPALSTPDADEVLQATLQHVVLSYSATNGRRLYVNGELIEVADEAIAPLANWDDSYALILGREASNQHRWQGDVRLLAIYNRELTAEQIRQNFEVGVGEKFYLLFAISEPVDLANTYVMFEVSQFDNYSYLFSGAALVNIDGREVTQAFSLSGMRLGINGKESVTGQAYVNLDATIGSGTDLSRPLPLSALGTIIGVEKGPELDEFFLTFERLGEQQHLRVEAPWVATAAIPQVNDRSDIGIRNFAEINHSMSVLTQVPQSQSEVAATYRLVQRQLPGSSNIETFTSAQQMGITQLAIAYCNAAFDDVAIRRDWLPDFDVDQAPDVALSVANRNHLITPLLARLLPQVAAAELASQPSHAQVTSELNQLIDRLSVCDGGCDSQRSATIGKAACAAVLSSATMLVQ